MIWSIASESATLSAVRNSRQQSTEYRENRYAVGRNGLIGNSHSVGRFGIGKVKTGKPKYHMGTRVYLWRLRNQ